MVSIIIPNYNHAAYLQQRIDSVLNQSFQDFEVILLDDCSTDNSREILESYSTHPKVSHAVFNDINSGSPFKQWLKGMALASGELIWLAESDDFADKRFLETALQRMHDTAADIVFVGTTNVDEAGRDLGNTTRIERKKAHLLDSDFTRQGAQLLAEFLPDYCIIRNASSAVFKKSLLSPRAKKVTTFRTIGDFYFWVVLVGEGARVSYVAQKLNFMRNHKNNVRQSDTKKAYKKAEYTRVENVALRLQGYAPRIWMPIFKKRLKKLIYA